VSGWLIWWVLLMPFWDIAGDPVSTAASSLA